jgi:pimeloyl-ACP methyl ester carboxylesterase
LIRAQVFEPAGAPRAVFCCLPGGGMSRRYFDLDVPGYSMARHLAALGFVVITIDPPGVGESDRPADGYSLTPDAVADAVASTVAELLRDVPAGLPRVGLGHSAGGLVTVVQQSRHRTYDALALLGFEGRGLVDMLTPEERRYAGDPLGLRDAIADLAATRFANPLPEGTTATSAFLLGPEEPPADALAALGASKSAMLALVGLTSMVPGSIRPELASVDVPVFLGVGEHDITGPPREIPPQLPACRDMTLFVLPGAGHNHNVAAERARLWDRLASWAGALAQLAPTASR